MRLRDGRVVPNFIMQALKSEPLTVYGEGQQTRSFQYVDDLIAGLNLLLEADHHLPVNIGNPNEFTVRELAELVLQETGSDSDIVSLPLPADDPKVRKPDITVARSVLGWEPRVDVREGLRRTIPYFREAHARGHAVPRTI
jgi:dTDP-glucose 4,6-dehydratase